MDLRISSGMEARLRRSHPTAPFRRLRTALLYVFLVSSGGWGRKSLVSAQSDCTEPRTEAIRVEDEAGVAALRSAVNCTNGGTVQATWAGRLPVGSPIVVAGGTFLSVTGEDDSAEVYASSVTWLFGVGTGGALTLTGLKLSGGSAREGGAISSSQADVVLRNCTFEGNVATAGNGGAVSATGGNVTIVGGDFSNNTAGRYGGAVFTNTGSLAVEGGASFENNEAIQGSALFCGGAEAVGVVCSLSDAVFTSNNAPNDIVTVTDDFAILPGGGAAAFLFANVSVTDSVFRGNFARVQAGALYGGIGSFLDVNGCTFEENESSVYGGAISASSMTLGGGTLISNNAVNRSGGGVSGIAATHVFFVHFFFVRMRLNCCLDPRVHDVIASKSVIPALPVPPSWCACC